MTVKTKTSIKINKISKKLDRYAGKWVAFVGAEIIASNNTLAGLMEKVKQKGVEVNQVSVFLVPRKDEGPYVLIVL